MKARKSNTPIRRTIISVATAATIALPGLASAGWWDQATSKVQTATANVTNTVSEIREERPVLNAVEELGGNLTDMDIIEKVKELNLKEQLIETIALMKHMQADYQYFTGGTRCAAECANFRTELKGVFNDFLSLVYDVPVLNADGALHDNLVRVLDVIDYIPPRALYLMWQTLSGRFQELRTALDEIRQGLAVLPPLEDDTGVTYSADATGTSYSTMSTNSSGRGAGFCGWARGDDMPLVELLQARLEMFAWRLKSAADLIPDVETKAEGGAAAGVFGSAGVGIKPTDQVKMLLKMIAYVPERINWAIKINSLRAQVGCKVAGY